MANFKAELPTELIKEFQKLERNTEKMMGEMTQAGAEVVERNIRANAPASLKNSNIMKCLKITRVYKTPTDEGINTKVAFYGYFINKQGKKVPAPLVANAFDKGTSKIKKKPFIRRSIKKTQIEEAMQKVQDKYLKGVK